MCGSVGVGGGKHGSMLALLGVVFFRVLRVILFYILFLSCCFSSFALFLLLYLLDFSLAPNDKVFSCITSTSLLCRYFLVCFALFGV